MGFFLFFCPFFCNFAAEKGFCNMIQTTIEDKGDRIVMYFEGRLDTPETPKVEKEMKVLEDVHDRQIVLDLTALKYVASSGLRLFLSLLQHARANNSTVTLVGLSPYIDRVLEETGFKRLFKLD